MTVEQVVKIIDELSLMYWDFAHDLRIVNNIHSLDYSIIQGCGYIDVYILSSGLFCIKYTVLESEATFGADPLYTNILLIKCVEPLTPNQSIEEYVQKNFVYQSLRVI